MTGLAHERRGFEPWAWLAFAIGLATLALFVALGTRPGAPLAVWLYGSGTLWLFLCAALVLVGALFWSVTHRPVLARRRAAPFAALGLTLLAASLPFPYPSSHAARWSSVAFRLPFDGAWRVRWGGERRTENALVYWPARRYGFDFVRADGPTLGATVRAPCAGRIVASVGDLADGAPERTPFGNHVVIEASAGEYLVLANLLQGSLRATVGDRVEAGAALAQVGDSAGASRPADPALLVHLQDAPEPGRGEGIPMRFHSYEADGRALEAGVPTGGMGPAGPRGQVVAPLGAR